MPFPALLVLSASLLTATPTPHQTGAYDTAFQHRSPDSAAERLVQRHGLPRDWPLIHDYDPAQERVHLHVPDAYDPEGEPFGLLVWVSPSPDAHVPPPYVDALAEHRLIWVSVYETGNRRQFMQRLGLAIDAAFNVPLYYHIDPERVYVAGLSGGGRTASRLGVNHADVFRGALPIIGCNFYKLIEIPSQPGKFWRPSHAPGKRIARTARQQPLVIVTGSEDGNREQCDAYARAYEKAGFSAVTYIEVPGMGHTFPEPGVFGQALTHLDERPDPTAKQLKHHALAQKHLDAALATHTDDPEAGLKKLRRVARRYGDTPAGRTARFTADRAEFPAEP